MPIRLATWYLTEMSKNKQTLDVEEESKLKWPKVFPQTRTISHNIKGSMEAAKK